MCKFAKNLKKLRLKNNFSIKYLAQLINVCPKTISSWENGKTYPSSTKLVQIVKIFNVSCNYILGL